MESTGLAYFPGLAKPIMIDTEDLPKEEAEEIVRLARAAHLSDQRGKSSEPAAGAADYRRQMYSIQDDNEQYTLRLVEPIEDSDMRALADYVKQLVRKRRRSRKRAKTKDAN